MLKKNKGLLFLTSLVVLLPILAGVLLWEQLPEMVATHWNAAGEADGWMSKGKAIFGMPLILLAVHWLCLLVVMADPKNKQIQGKMFNLVVWIVPFVSVLVGVITVGTALGWAIPVETVMPLMIGILFVAVGNYIPKCRQSYTVGIRLPWTLHDEENWTQTHRLAGKVWMVGGILMIADALLHTAWITIAAVLAMCIIPILYSYLLFRRKKSSEDEAE